MSGFWLGVAIFLVGMGAIKTADCALQVPGACAHVAERYVAKPK